MIKSERQLIQDLKSKGYKFIDADNLFRSKSLNSEVVNIILYHLSSIYEEHIGTGDTLVRSLLAAEDEFDSSILVKLFNNKQYNKSIKWSIAYVLAKGKSNISEKWFLNNLRKPDEKNSFEYSGLLWGIPEKLISKDSKNIRALILDIMPIYYKDDQFQKLLKKYFYKQDCSMLLLAMSAIKEECKPIMKIIDGLKPLSN